MEVYRTVCYTEGFVILRFVILEYSCVRVSEPLLRSHSKSVCMFCLYPSLNVQGFKGRWLLERRLSAGIESTMMRYEIQVVPKLKGVWLPRPLVAYLLNQGLPANISALAAQAERIAQARLAFYWFLSTVRTIVYHDFPSP